MTKSVLFCHHRDAVIRRMWPLDRPAAEVLAEVLDVSGPAVTAYQVSIRANTIGVKRSAAWKFASARAASVQARVANAGSKRPRNASVWTPARVEALRQTRLMGAMIPELVDVVNGPPFQHLPPVSAGKTRHALKSFGVVLPTEMRQANMEAGRQRGIERRRAGLTRHVPPPVRRPRLVAPAPQAVSPQAQEAVVAVAPPLEPPPGADGYVPMTFTQIAQWVASTGREQDARRGLGYTGANVAAVNKLRAWYRLPPVVQVEHVLRAA